MVKAKGWGGYSRARSRNISDYPMARLLGPGLGTARDILGTG